MHIIVNKNQVQNSILVFFLHIVHVECNTEKLDQHRNCERDHNQLWPKTAENKV